MCSPWHSTLEMIFSAGTNRWRRTEQLRQARDQHAPHTRGGRCGCKARGAAARHAACLWRLPGMLKRPLSECCSSPAAHPSSGLLYATLQRMPEPLRSPRGAVVPPSALTKSRAFALSTPRLPDQRECVLRAARA